VIDSCNCLGLGHGSRVMRVTGQLNDGSRGSPVTRCDLLSALCPIDRQLIPQTELWSLIVRDVV